MPEENKIKKDDPQVDIDTSGPDVSMGTIFFSSGIVTPSYV